MFASSYIDNSVVVWHKESKSPQFSFKVNQPLTAIGISSNNRLLALGFSTGLIKVIDIESGEIVKQFIKNNMISDTNHDFERSKPLVY